MFCKTVWVCGHQDCGKEFSQKEFAAECELTHLKKIEVVASKIETSSGNVIKGSDWEVRLFKLEELNSSGDILVKMDSSKSGTSVWLEFVITREYLNHLD